MRALLSLRIRSLAYVVAGCLIFAGPCPGQDRDTAPRNDSTLPQGQFVNRILNDAQGVHKYVVFVPANYRADKKWPVILFLHGACNRGVDGRSQLVSGLAPSIRLRMSDYPFLVVFPQCENIGCRVLGGWTDLPDDAARALLMLDSVEKDYNVDTKRECLVGLSMGGSGAWDIAAKTPNRWAALVPVSAMANQKDAPKVAGIPTWVFHATHDPLVPTRVATNMVDAIKIAGGHAYFSEVTKKGHDLSNVVFTQQSFTDWLLDPKQKPNQDLEWIEPKGYSSGLDLEVPFVPGAELARALRFRVCKDVLDALCYAAPKNLAQKPMLGSVAPVHQSTKLGGFLPLSVALSGLHYQGQIEQVRIIPKAPNRLILQAGLRNFTMTVQNSQVNGKLMLSASAGPMNVVIGHRAPVWLTMELRPHVQNHRLQLNLTGMDFQIPADNWYVTEPSGVHVRGLPFLNSKVSEGLVNGVYSRKGEIERQVLNSLPSLVQKFETKINDIMYAKTLCIGQISMPMWQPRLKMFPEEILIDDDGITMVSGITLCTLGQTPKGLQAASYAAPKEFPAPIKTGVEVNVSESVVPAWSKLIINGKVSCFNVFDFTPPEYHALADREFLQEIIPDLKKYGEKMEANVDFYLRDPIRLRTPDLSSASRMIENAPGNLMTLSLSSVPLRVAIRQQGESKWTPVGELNMSIEREYAPHVKKTGFVGRGLKFAELSNFRIVPQWSFSQTYTPDDSHVDADRLVTSIIKAREAAQILDGVKPDNVSDVVMHGICLRMETMDWRKDHVVIQYQLPGVLVTNDSNQPLTYEVRGPDTDWSASRTLKPGGFDQYRVPYPMTWRRRDGAASQLYTLPLGSEYSFRINPKPSLVLVTHENRLHEERMVPQ
jgi:poly(3-hydroxybutyrate) depolymerase